MLDEKKLMINCDLCDTRNIKEEDYKDYKKILINSDLVLVSEESKSILNKLPIVLNNDEMIKIPDDIEVDIKTINGSGKITGKTQVNNNTLLIVNGCLDIEAGTEEQLKKFIKIIVNGSVRYPDSLGAYLSKASINGSSCNYPDNCIILKRRFVMDKYFALRAQSGGQYYAEKEIVVNNDVDFKKLAEKNVSFKTNKVVISENLVEEAAPLINEEAEFIVVPDGMRLIYGDTILNDELLRKKGKDLFIYGDMTIEKDTDLVALAEFINKIIVKGDVHLNEEHKAAFSQIDIEYNQLIIEKNTRKLVNMLKVKVDKLILDNSPEGVEIKNVARVEIAEDVTPKMILDKLIIRNCAQVICSTEQESSVSAIGKNIASIGSEDENSKTYDYKNVKTINADRYIL